MDQIIEYDRTLKLDSIPRKYIVGKHVNPLVLETGVPNIVVPDGDRDSISLKSDPGDAVKSRARPMSAYFAPLFGGGDDDAEPAVGISATAVKVDEVKERRKTEGSGGMFASLESFTAGLASSFTKEKTDEDDKVEEPKNKHLEMPRIGTRRSSFVEEKSNVEEAKVEEPLTRIGTRRSSMMPAEIKSGENVVEVDAIIEEVKEPVPETKTSTSLSEKLSRLFTDPEPVDGDTLPIEDDDGSMMVEDVGLNNEKSFAQLYTELAGPASAKHLSSAPPLPPGKVIVEPAKAKPIETQRVKSVKSNIDAVLSLTTEETLTRPASMKPATILPRRPNSGSRKGKERPNSIALDSGGNAFVPYAKLGEFGAAKEEEAYVPSGVIYRPPVVSGRHVDPRMGFARPRPGIRLGYGGPPLHHGQAPVKRTNSPPGSVISSDSKASSPPQRPMYSSRPMYAGQQPVFIPTRKWRLVNA
jgi:hypothetical protein